MSFLQNKLIAVLKSLPDTIKSRAPLITKILSLTYNLHLPLKFFEMNRLDMTDKIGNKFYIVSGPVRGYFPFLEILEAEKYSTTYTIYIVDYTYEIVKTTDQESLRSESLSSSNRSSRTSRSSGLSDSLCQSPFDINYGMLSPDHFLPKYIYHISKYLATEDSIQNKIKILAEYVDTLLCGPKAEYTIAQKIHRFKLHIESLKTKLGTNMIPIGFLRIGFHCERALLFKAIADKSCIPTSLVKGRSKLYWNEVALFDSKCNDDTLTFYVVDLMDNVGKLLKVGSRDANQYCNIKA
ncbi:hypothetical protein NQ314_010467 [Rhamnusium bicolor]|uniref:EDR1/CTR1/ARMC3-like peptidase-like domain-containing protein n=1 Tax=Rhamnusium bicolor TaxID=1586634 RepID=A0AAV8XQ37_9CUCU|nr:hypothetical protein NQ314_010467 [Rhamnusium bicolor]